MRFPPNCSGTFVCNAVSSFFFFFFNNLLFYDRRLLKEGTQACQTRPHANVRRHSRAQVRCDTQLERLWRRRRTAAAERTKKKACRIKKIYIFFNNYKERFCFFFFLQLLLMVASAALMFPPPRPCLNLLPSQKEHSCGSVAALLFFSKSCLH